MAQGKQPQDKTEGAGRAGVRRTTMARIRIDAEEIVMALDDHDVLVTWHLDRESGELLRISEALLGDEDQELVARIETEPARYLFIEALPSNFGYRLLSEFTATVEDAVARAALERALDGRRPFRAFKDALFDYPPVRDHWFRFHHERILEEARLWLEAEGVDFEWTGKARPA
jgi:hypothetical protein